MAGKHDIVLPTLIEPPPVEVGDRCLTRLLCKRPGCLAWMLSGSAEDFSSRRSRLKEENHGCSIFIGCSYGRLFIYIGFYIEFYRLLYVGFIGVC